jgi:hypothetical protein
LRLKNITGLWITILLVAVICSCQRIDVPQNARADATPQKKKAPAPAPTSDIYGPPVKLAELEDKTIDESSGLVASRTTPGSYWTHNDSGNGPEIYAFDSNGRRRGVWKVTGATSEDWEDIAYGPGPKANTSYLYIGDIGDNTGNRTGLIIWRVPEPVIPASDNGSTVKNPVATEPAEAIRLRYPDGHHDSEALLVHPVTGRIYLVTKVPVINPSIYAGDLPKTPGETVTLQRLGEIDMPGMLGGIISGGAVSPDGTRAALCDYIQGYEFVLPNPSAPFDSIWKQPMQVVDLGKRKHGETIAYRLDGKAIMVTSERLPAPLIQIVRK